MIAGIDENYSEIQNTTKILIVNTDIALFTFHPALRWIARIIKCNVAKRGSGPRRAMRREWKLATR